MPEATCGAAATVAAVCHESYTRASATRAIAGLIHYLDRPLAEIVPRGSRVLVKVNMGCSASRDPSQRLTTHPFLLEAIIGALQSCGAQVGFGDDIARSGLYYQRIYDRTGLAEVARRTGARLIDFVAAKGREVRGRLLHPRHYLVTNAYFDADVVINAASFRSHVGIGVSGAVKNMFGCVLDSGSRPFTTCFHPTRKALAKRSPTSTEPFPRICLSSI